jgi:hypothetical protein
MDKFDYIIDGNVPSFKFGSFTSKCGNCNSFVYINILSYNEIKKIYESSKYFYAILYSNYSYIYSKSSAF